MVLICMISFLMTTFVYSSSKLADNLGSIILNFHLNLWSLFFLFLSYFLFSFNLEIQIPWVWYALFFNNYSIF